MVRESLESLLRRVEDDQPADEGNERLESMDGGGRKEEAALLGPNPKQQGSPSSSFSQMKNNTPPSLTDFGFSIYDF